MSGRKLSVAVIGLGYWGPNILRNLTRFPDRVEVRAICDQDEGRLLQARRLAPEAEPYTDPEAVFRREDIEAVFIVTPAVTHYALGRQSLEAGKHTFVEKPLALKAEQGEELVRLAEAQGRILMTGHIMVYHPATRRLKEIVDAGELGEVLYLYAHRLNLGKVRKDENALWSLAPHDLSMIFYLLEEEKPLWVMATGAAYLRSGVEDVVFLTLKFPSGVLAHVHVSWLDPHKVRKLTVVGNRKMAVLDDMNPQAKLWVYDKGAEVDPEKLAFGENISLRFGDVILPFVPPKEPLYEEVREFLDAVQEGRPPVTDGREGLKVVRVLEAAEQSLKSGRPVAL